MQTQAAAELDTTTMHARSGWDWTRLLVLGATLILAAPLIPMLAEGFEPFLAVLVVPVLLGLILLRLARRAGVVWLGVVSLALLVMNAGFVPDALKHPESPADFVPVSMLTVGAMVAVIATIPAYRLTLGRPSAWRPPTFVARTAIAVIAAAVAGSVVAASRVTSDAPAGGSTAVAIEDFSFGPSTINVSSGRALLYVTNSDAARHTFTVDDLGVDVSIAPGQSKLVELDASSGIYRFYCKPHAGGMEGVIVVS